MRRCHKTNEDIKRSSYSTRPEWWQTIQKTHLALGTQRMYMQPILFPRRERVRNTSIMSSSLWEYWNSARCVRWSFHLASWAPVPVTDAPLRTRRVDVPVDAGVAEPASRSGKKAYVGSGGRNASLAAMRPGQGGQQNRQQSSLRERPFILHLQCARGRQENCTVDSCLVRVLTQRDSYYNGIHTN